MDGGPLKKRLQHDLLPTLVAVAGSTTRKKGKRSSGSPTRPSCSRDNKSHAADQEQATRRCDQIDVASLVVEPNMWSGTRDSVSRMEDRRTRRFGSRGRICRGRSTVVVFWDGRHTRNIFNNWARRYGRSVGLDINQVLGEAMESDTLWPTASRGDGPHTMILGSGGDVLGLLNMTFDDAPSPRRFRERRCGGSRIAMHIVLAALTVSALMTRRRLRPTTIYRVTAPNLRHFGYGYEYGYGHRGCVDRHWKESVDVPDIHRKVPAVGSERIDLYLGPVWREFAQETEVSWLWRGRTSSWRRRRRRRYLVT